MIRECSYDIDYGTIEVTMENGSRLTLLRSAIENSLEVDMIGDSKLQWLVDNELTTYVQLYLEGELQEYCTEVERSYHAQSARLHKQLTGHFQDAAYAEAITREIMMYQ